LVSGHKGANPAPLAKVASGGELSRVSLALSVVASQATQIPTLVFDEVDSGVSGAVAEMVGRLLRELGQHHQVLCVTHLPQVAACAQHHFQVSKAQGQGDQVSSAIERLDQSARVGAVAQLLGGVKITDTTREHARELLRTHNPLGSASD
jgi:DNA repair protein RecN (Recombination protein N)